MPENAKRYLHEVLEEYRRAHDLTIPMLARILGVGLGRTADWLSGTVVPGKDMIKRLSRQLKFSPSDVVQRIPRAVKTENSILTFYYLTRRYASCYRSHPNPDMYIFLAATSVYMRLFLMSVKCALCTARTESGRVGKIVFSSPYAAHSLNIDVDQGQIYLSITDIVEKRDLWFAPLSNISFREACRRLNICEKVNPKSPAE